MADVKHLTCEEILKSIADKPLVPYDIQVYEKMADRYEELLNQPFYSSAITRPTVHRVMRCFEEPCGFVGFRVILNKEWHGYNVVNLERKFLQGRREKIVLSVAKRDKRGFLETAYLPCLGNNCLSCDVTSDIPCLERQEHHFDRRPEDGTTFNTLVLIQLDGLVMEAGVHGTPIDI